MKIKIKRAIDLSNRILQNFGLSKRESELVTKNLIEAELTGKISHGLLRLTTFKDKIAKGRINITDSRIKVINQTQNSLHIDGEFKIGISIIYQSISKAFELVKNSGVICVGIKDIEFSGYIGDYARKTAAQDLIFIGLNNSTGKIIPFGSLDRMWGTNPITVGIPTSDDPVILDMATSKITWGDLLISNNRDERISKGVAIDNSGGISDIPSEIIDGGGLLPIAGYKGSGLAFIVELLAGGLTGSQIGYSVSGGWGSFYILIDPTLFRPIKDFKNDVGTAINELKNSRKSSLDKEIFFAGEQSNQLRAESLRQGILEVDERLYSALLEYE